MTESTKKLFYDCRNSYEFGAFVESLNVIFKNDENLSNWIYGDGANLPEYINAIGSVESVTSISDTVNKMLIGYNLKKVSDLIKKDKKAYKFVVAWLGENNLPDNVKAQFAKIKSSKRNTYSLFLTMLVSFTSDNATPVSLANSIEAHNKEA